MAGDLEDFLRRAAARRQAKAGQAAAPAQPQPQQQQSRAQRARQEYTNRNTERQVRQEDIVVAEVVEEDPFAARRQKIANAKKLAAKARAQANKAENKQKAAKASAKQAAKAASKSKSAAKVGPELGGAPIDDLLKLIRQPNGIQQAVLLREILDRPKW